MTSQLCYDGYARDLWCGFEKWTAPFIQAFHQGLKSGHVCPGLYSYKQHIKQKLIYTTIFLLIVNIHKISGYLDTWTPGHLSVVYDHKYLPQFNAALPW